MNEAERLLKIMEGYKDEDTIRRKLIFEGGRIGCVIEHKCINSYLHRDFWYCHATTVVEMLVDALDWFEDNR